MLLGMYVGGVNSHHLRYLQAALKSNHSSQISMTADLGKTPKSDESEIVIFALKFLPNLVKNVRR